MPISFSVVFPFTTILATLSTTIDFAHTTLAADDLQHDVCLKFAIVIPMFTGHIPVPYWTLAYALSALS
ncbi:MAG: hypothetical protein AAF959_18060 [Cyanobacteria bacterium P01_D01_bin.56]